MPEKFCFSVLILPQPISDLVLDTPLRTTKQVRIRAETTVRDGSVIEIVSENCVRDTLFSGTKPQ